MIFSDIFEGHKIKKKTPDLSSSNTSESKLKTAMGSVMKTQVNVRHCSTFQSFIQPSVCVK